MGIDRGIVQFYIGYWNGLPRCLEKLAETDMILITMFDELNLTASKQTNDFFYA